MTASTFGLYTCVVSYHTNPYTCGVARFNKSLADSLGVPLVGVAKYLLDAYDTALLSLKFEEVDEHSAKELLASIKKDGIQFGILLHAVTDIAIEQEYIALAKNELDWLPRTTLDTGLQSTIHWIATMEKNK